MNEGELVDLVENIIRKGFLKEEGNTLRFTEPILAEVLEESMSKFKRAYLHKRITQTLEVTF